MTMFCLGMPLVWIIHVVGSVLVGYCFCWYGFETVDADKIIAHVDQLLVFCTLRYVYPLNSLATNCLL